MTDNLSKEQKTIRTYRISDVAPYINWFYFFHTWGLPASMVSLTRVHDCEGCTTAWVKSLPDEMQDQGKEALNLYHDALRTLSSLDAEHNVTQAVAIICQANSDGDDILVNYNGLSTRLPMLRQQSPDNDGLCYCLSDFIRPSEAGDDCIGLFATSASRSIVEYTKDNDPYNAMMRQTLADRLAEATADKFHEEVRRQIWGYAPHERLPFDELHSERYQGIRPATGYPSMPDISLNVIIDSVLQLKDIGIKLTETGMMQPHASVCGLMIAHPKAKYFSVGHIDETQLRDYAARRGMNVEQMRSYLANSL